MLWIMVTAVLLPLLIVGSFFNPVFGEHSYLERPIEHSNTTIEAFLIDYLGYGAQIKKVQADYSEKKLVFDVYITETPAFLEIELPRELLDSKDHAEDEDYKIIYDGNRAGFDEVEASASHRTLNISLRGVTASEFLELEIFGTQIFDKHSQKNPKITEEKEVEKNKVEEIEQDVEIEEVKLEQEVEEFEIEQEVEIEEVKLEQEVEEIEIKQDVEIEEVKLEQEVEEIEIEQEVEEIELEVVQEPESIEKIKIKQNKKPKQKQGPKHIPQLQQMIETLMPKPKQVKEVIQEPIPKQGPKHIPQLQQMIETLMPKPKQVKEVIQEPIPKQVIDVKEEPEIDITPIRESEPFNFPVAANTASQTISDTILAEVKSNHKIESVVNEGPEAEIIEEDTCFICKNKKKSQDVNPQIQQLREQIEQEKAEIEESEKEVGFLDGFFKLFQGLFG